MIINGKEGSFETGITIKELLMKLELNEKIVVIEINHKIVPKKQYSSFVLNEGDKVEIVSFMAGG
ncbi:sulfur carrier protein [Anaerovirgula multivorans]|uniref:Sulfur carrier protein n=1 Tax=Anaerovirgula multivorans TaxID=312168 RepID=A0A239FLE7_9FIRM|nr:sulfur carrier protein ThiS [Anaerovirgula multivorans]SNS57690.1 sulfur carrier protein [Anaerovirgula multivorans]